MKHAEYIEQKDRVERCADILTEIGEMRDTLKATLQPVKCGNAGMLVYHTIAGIRELEAQRDAI